MSDQDYAGAGFEARVLWVDNHVLALDKPWGLLSQPSGTEDESLEAQGKAWIKEKFGKPGAVFLEAVHRIDKPVCGLVLFARTSKALSRMSAAVREGRVEKVYRAIVSGHLAAERGTLRSWLVHEAHHARAVAAGFPGAREASLDYRVLSVGELTSHLEIVLGTGRYHQIRVQLAQAGHPIIGDERYGARLRFRPGAIALQHYRLSFPHPVSGEQIVVQSRFELV